jgi:hypothetical protein
MKNWTVYMEAWAPTGKVGSLDNTDSRVSDFTNALVHWSGIVSVDQHRWAVQITLPEDSAISAAGAAKAHVFGVARSCRLPLWPVERLEVVDAERHDSDHQVSSFPDLVGTTEVAEILDISRQRIHELRKAGRFPEPVVELAGGPIWVRATITAFDERWERKVGRPRTHRATPVLDTNGAWVVSCPACGGVIGASGPLSSEPLAQQLADDHANLFGGTLPRNQMVNLVDSAHGTVGPHS